MDMSGIGGHITTFTGLTSTHFVIEQIDADMYYYRVQAVCSDGTSDWTDWMDVDIASPLNEIPAADGSEGEMAGGKWSDGQIYDMSGCRLQGTPQQGLYIRNGKVYMAR